MKLTQVLCKHHIGRTIRQMWYQRRQRKVTETETERHLSQFRIQIKDALDLIKPKVERENIELPPRPPRVTYDETHPAWKTRTCLIVRDHNVLQEGLPQAQILTNTISLSDLPSSIEDSLPDLPGHVDDIVKRAIYNSSIFDAYQEKLPVKKDPLRPAWVFPRDFGISNGRRMRNLSRKFLQICESISGPSVAEKRCILYNEPMKLSFDKETDLIQFKLKSDVVIMSASPLKSIDDPDSHVEIDLPSIYPLHHTISLDKTNFYRTEDVYPIRSVNILSPWKNVHTIFAFHNPRKVRNLTELAVTESQIAGCTMIKSYTAAASCARYRFGASVTELPEPVTVQAVQTDGRRYQFFVFQLNSLDVNDAGVKNFWYTLPPLALYEKAQYDDGRPVLEGYNPEVFRRIVAFYRNGS
ncbi:hypothetical protein DMN91_011665 [Ooceraea biroi]|uniref:Large ribosomal subunit protein mL37 n=1 Tax=Ooceraea biroi TaxID=2015173 RepID=A0A026WIE1_OOCBI|nr:39S ribosomal protein L37, mitochondrial [Ooceraea biroi]XP_011336548.1 39S ribosomal protein L37, mitochondrial [Ooceraea biroi]XP_011336549.1 39S ribosomal protein L37, mitochondrial [Ooceraea biroi]EZA55817.1 39S ribosomal protein L37, mitochondrial [Ooceraea biroi]RLU15908.1 hypothetical protein DMN91_011665 [Ooceraea biroi]